MTISKELFHDYIHRRVSKTTLKYNEVREQLKEGTKVYCNDIRRSGVFICFNNNHIGVQFDEHFAGHDCQGAVDNYNAWWCDIKRIEILSNEE